jgi:hypothetical protein
MEKVYWITKQGQKLDIDDMSEAHVKNILKMILRTSRTAQVKAREDFHIPKSIERKLLEEGIMEEQWAREEEIY